MKNAKKVIVLALCAILLVAASVMGTLAYLTSTAEVKNTFTAGNVIITMDEAKVDEYGVVDANANRVTENKYKLVPGHTYTKDPTIYVDANSEDCWVFVKIENGLGNDATINMEADWVNVTANVWAYSTKLQKNGSATPFKSFTFAANANPAAFENANITVTAYAIQADNMNTYQEAWVALNGQLNIIP